MCTLLSPRTAPPGGHQRSATFKKVFQSLLFLVKLLVLPRVRTRCVLSVCVCVNPYACVCCFERGCRRQREELSCLKPRGGRRPGQVLKWLRLIQQPWGIFGILLSDTLIVAGRPGCQRSARKSILSATAPAAVVFSLSITLSLTLFFFNFCR